MKFVMILSIAIVLFLSIIALQLNKSKKNSAYSITKEYQHCIDQTSDQNKLRECNEILKKYKPEGAN